MTVLMLKNIEVKKDILLDEKYKYIFSVEEMNKLVLQGMPLRDAYKKIGIHCLYLTFFLPFIMPTSTVRESSAENLEVLCICQWGVDLLLKGQ